MTMKGISSLLMSGIAIPAIMVGLLAFGNSIVDVAAQGNNMTDGSQSLDNDSQSPQLGAQIYSGADSKCQCNKFCYKEHN
jgi:hypothetical protein